MSPAVVPAPGQAFLLDVDVLCAMAGADGNLKGRHAAQAGVPDADWGATHPPGSAS